MTPEEATLLSAYLHILALYERLEEKQAPVRIWRNALTTISQLVGEPIHEFVDPEQFAAKLVDKVRREKDALREHISQENARETLEILRDRFPYSDQDRAKAVHWITQLAANRKNPHAGIVLLELHDLHKQLVMMRAQRAEEPTQP